jgi:hypothetical protein
MNSLIPEVLLLLRRAERLLTIDGQDHTIFNSDRIAYRRWEGENVEITRFMDGDFHIKVTDPYWPDRFYAMVWKDETLRAHMDLVAEVNKRLEKITVLDDLADS